MSKLLIDEFDIIIVNIRVEQPRIIILPKKMINAYSLHEVHNNKRT